MFNRKTILKKTFQVGFLTQLSRFLGVIREVLMVQYLGVGVLSDAFITAFKVPNSLRKIFAEGALSAALIPSIVQVSKQKKQTDFATQFITAAFLFFEGTCFLLALLFMIRSENIIDLIAVGFLPEQKAVASRLLFILMPFILCISISSLFAGALQAQGHFLIPAAGPLVLNIFFLAALTLCLFKQLAVSYLCVFIVVAGMVQAFIHSYAYYFYQGGFSWPDKAVISPLKHMIKKFLLCLPSISFSEINLFIDTTFASLLSSGSISLLYYANRFMGIPLGVLVGSLTTVLLPQLSHIALSSPKRLSLYIFESIKLILWVTIPVTIVMIITAHQLFYSTFFSKNFSLEQVEIAGTVLQVFCVGLPFLSLNRLFLNVFYALHRTFVPAIISLISVVVNIVCNYLLLYNLKIIGLALATSISAVLQMILFMIALHYYGYTLYLSKLAGLLFKYMICLLAIGIPIKSIHYTVLFWLPSGVVDMYVGTRFGYWFLAGPLSILFCVLIFLSRKKAGFRSFFID
ncbi:murein biosynthesis integral membrane protein MurJ [bacterium]|nr:MAG: murein biosynthesis integral membrane protein MurJ [bacterium]QQR62168.1 MAG: murein biosynthesis integral membrane protein MurJ [bacterium]